MKAIVISRPGDFGVLEEHWTKHPLFLPLPGGSVIALHEASLAALGITEARLLQCHPSGEAVDLEALEHQLRGRRLSWSVRGWPQGPWPRGWNLSQALLQQAVFLSGEDALVFSVPAADPRGWTGPKVPTGFPAVEARSLLAQRWEASGRLIPWDGPLVSLGGTRDFFRASMRFLETLPPPPLVLRGIHRHATLEPPLLLGLKIRAAARSRLDHGTSLARTLVLTPTRFARDFAVADKIVIGDSVVEPVGGEVVALSRALSGPSAAPGGSS